MITIDFIFSYWIFILFLFYYITKFNPINPFLLLCGALIEQTFAFFYYVYKGLPIITLTIYVFIIVLIKGIPLYLLRNTKKWNPIFSVSFFLSYLLYLQYKGTNLFEIYRKVNESMLKGTNDTPFFYYLTKIGINPT